MHSGKKKRLININFRHGGGLASTPGAFPQVSSCLDSTVVTRRGIRVGSNPIGAKK